MFTVQMSQSQVTSVRIVGQVSDLKRRIRGALHSVERNAE